MEYLTDQEQVERLRAWWKEYGLAVIAGVVLAIVVIVSVRYYRSYTTKKSEAASLIYTTMINSALSQQAQSAVASAQELTTHYGNTPYGAYAGLWLAKSEVMHQQYPMALQQLKWVMTHANMDSVRQVARLRAAQIELQLQKPKEALALLKSVNDKAYLGMVNETRGDAYLQQHDMVAAKEAYETALSQIPEPAQTSPLLQMKLASLPAVN